MKMFYIATQIYFTANRRLGRKHKFDIISVIYKANSVYFNVPNKYLNDYGELIEIKADWFEYKTNPIFVTRDSEMSDYMLNNCIGKNIGTGYDDNYKYSLYYGDEMMVAPGNADLLMDWGYNISNKDDYEWWEKVIDWFTLGGTSNFTVKERCPEIFYFFDSQDNQDIFNYELSTYRLKDYIYTYNKSFHNGTLPIKNNTISADLFASSVDAGRTKGHNVHTCNINDTFDLLSYDDTHSFWEELLEGGFYIPNESSLKDKKPIQDISLLDFAGTDESISKNLLINENDINDIKKSMDFDSTTFLFRFAQTDYFSQKVSAYYDNKINTSTIQSYMAEETVFLDFDIIQLTFEQNEMQSVIPAVSSPIDIVPEVEAPVKEDNPIENAIEDIANNSGFDWTRLLKIIAAVVIGIILLLILIPILPYIIKGLVWLITLPIKIITRIVKTTKSLSNKNKYKDKGGQK